MNEIPKQRLTLPALHKRRPRLKTDLTREECFLAIESAVVRTTKKIIEEVVGFTGGDYYGSVDLIERLIDDILDDYPNSTKKTEDKTIYIAASYIHAKKASELVGRGEVNAALEACDTANRMLGRYTEDIHHDDLILDIENFKKGAGVHKKKTDAYWEPWIEKFDKFIAGGKTTAWARNKIGNLIEASGEWSELSKTKDEDGNFIKDDHGHRVILTRPSRKVLTDRLKKRSNLNL